VSAPPNAPAPAGRPAGCGGQSVWWSPAAVVAFSGRADLWWLPLLKPGFRHCLVALAQPEGGWILLDPMAHVIRVAAMPARFDPMAWFLAHGLLPVPVRPAAPVPRAAPWAPFTCVEAVKRALGIRARFVLTPWQLFRHLTREKKKVLDNGDIIGL
jgi:hypothetical protein